MKFTLYLILSVIVSIIASIVGFVIVAISMEYAVGMSGTRAADLAHTSSNVLLAVLLIYFVIIRNLRT